MLSCMVVLWTPLLVSAVRSSWPPEPPQRRDTTYGYYNPMDGGGSMLTVRPAFHYPCQNVDVMPSFTSAASAKYISSRTRGTHQCHTIRLL